MKVVGLFILLLLGYQCSAQLTRDYFFDEKLEVNDSSSLILIIRNSQTQFATELNHRIYEDTAFIRQLKDTWFIEYDKAKGHSRHRCGHDMFFYNLSGSEFTYLNQMNSNCGITEVGCTNINVLLQSGRPLNVDTLTRIGIRTYRDDLFTDNLIEAYYEYTQDWGNCRTAKYPIIYYDGLIREQIHLDTNFTLEQNAENFLRKFTDDFEDLNWNITLNVAANPSTISASKFEDKVDPAKIELQIYMKSNRFQIFNEYEIEKVNFNIERGRNLILFYRN